MVNLRSELMLGSARSMHVAIYGQGVVYVSFQSFIWEIQG